MFKVMQCLVVFTVIRQMPFTIFPQAHNNDPMHRKSYLVSTKDGMASLKKTISSSVHNKTPRYILPRPLAGPPTSLH
jgi:hypothetical protein